MVVVYYDLETTGLIRGASVPSICQIGASSTDGRTFNRFCIPEKDVEADATKINGIEMRGGKMFKNGSKVDASSTYDTLNGFMSWLKSHSSDVILLAHNGTRFDNRVLRHALKANDVAMASNVVRLGDTIDLMKQVLHRRSDLSLKTLTREFVPDFVFAAHDALEDAAALRALVERAVGDEREVRGRMEIS